MEANTSPAAGTSPPIIPSADEIRAMLVPLNMRQIERLAELSSVPSSTIQKIRSGYTENPGIETVRKLLPHVPPALNEARDRASAVAARLGINLDADTLLRFVAELGAEPMRSATHTEPATTL